jgi:calcineurin-like phosphoesterase family protein
MATIWLISDTHFTHANILTFTGDDGNLIRPGFATVEEMDETMVERWNAVVRPSDHVYHLGDVAMHRRYLPIVQRLNGKKRLIRGNHDDRFRTRDLLACGFQEIHGIRVIDRAMLTHVPVHPACLGRFRGNIHGHLHQNASPDGPYLNVCVEQTNYTPITLEDAIKQLVAKKINENIMQPMVLS